MSLIAIRQYLSERKMATLSEIASAIATEPHVVQGMLEIWIHKGKVSRNLVQPTKCQGCHHECGAETALEVFKWLE